MKAVESDEELLNMALELMELSQKAESPVVRKLLENFSTGLSQMDEDCHQHPFLTPLTLPNPDRRFVGQTDDVGALDCMQIDNCLVSVWHTDNFWYRWMFLVHGTIALELWNTPPPIGLRLDTEALGFTVE